MKSRFYLLPALVISLCIPSYNALAQDVADIVNFSTLQPQGTARSMGFGGALGSIGGDFTSLSVNPAGIGIYRSSEIMFTPSMRFNNTESKYTGVQTSDNLSRFTFNNAGFVLTSASTGRRYERSKWKAYSFGFGINRIADFNRDYAYEGYNKSSAAEKFLIDAKDYPGDLDNLNTLAGLGFHTYLLDTFNNNTFTLVDYLGGTNQLNVVKERGGLTDINLSFGGNYEEKLMIGGTLGLPHLKFNREVVYTETDPTNNNNNDFDNFVYTQTLDLIGNGLNLKLGLIYKPNDNFRLGAAFHTPTYYTITSTQNRSLSVNTENYKFDIYDDASGPVTTAASDESISEYSMTTPGRVVLSAAALFGKYGFITADYEYVNYAGAKYKYDSYYKIEENAINRNIKSTYTGASNFRLGIEGRYDNFMGRIGAGYYGSPYKDASLKGERLDLSVGAGLRFDAWYADVALVHSIYETQENPYVVDYGSPIPLIAPIATTSNNFNTVALTVGFKF